MTSKTRVPHGGVCRWWPCARRSCSPGAGAAEAAPREPRPRLPSVPAAPAPTPAATTTTQADASDPGAGTPSRKPCDLLTKSIAETALGGAVRDSEAVIGPGQRDLRLPRCRHHFDLAGVPDDLRGKGHRSVARRGRRASSRTRTRSTMSAMRLE